MAAPLWILQANLRDRALLAELQACLTASGTEFCSVPVQPFVPELPALPVATDGRPVVCYGPSFVPRVARHGVWQPGSFFDEATFRWSVMQQHWRDLMFAADGRAMPLAEANDVLASTGETCFVRPDADSKSFDGGLFDAAALQALFAPANETVVVAQNRAIDAEWRCFVVAGDIVAASEYRRNGQPSFHPDAPLRVMEIAAAAIERWNPAPVYALDLARSGDTIGVVEANCFSAARFYAADVATIIAAVTEYVRRS